MAELFDRLDGWPLALVLVVLTLAVSWIVVTLIKLWRY